MQRPDDVQRLAKLVERVGGVANAADLGRAWGVSRERVRQLIASGDFPEPVAMVGRGPVWARSEADAWRRATAPADGAKLHDAMRKVLRGHDGWVAVREVADEISDRDLYRRADGRHPDAVQVRARARRYAELFELTSDGTGRVRLR